MAAEAPIQQATASQWTMLRAFVHDCLEKIGLGPSTTLIRNESDKPIFLIPITCYPGNSPSSIAVNKSLAMRIQPKKVELVNCTQYVRTPATETHILFLAGTENTDSIEKFLKDFDPKGIKSALPHNYLYNKRILSLTLQDGEVKVDATAGQVEEKDKKEQAEQTPVTWMGSILDKLIKDVDELNREVDKLKKEVRKLRNTDSQVQEPSKSPSCKR